MNISSIQARVIPVVSHYRDVYAHRLEGVTHRRSVRQVARRTFDEFLSAARIDTVFRDDMMNFRIGFRGVRLLDARIVSDDLYDFLVTLDMDAGFPVWHEDTKRFSWRTRRHVYSLRPSNILVVTDR